MKRSPELDAMAAADEAEISNRNVKRNQTVGMAALLLAGVFAAYLVLATSGESPPESPESEEEFRTTTFRPPGFVRDGEPAPPPPEQPVLELPPPPPPSSLLHEESKVAKAIVKTIPIFLIDIEQKHQVRLLKNHHSLLFLIAH
mgnify:CR=1 FL=1